MVPLPLWIYNKRLPKSNYLQILKFQKSVGGPPKKHFNFHVLYDQFKLLRFSELVAPFYFSVASLATQAAASGFSLVYNQVPCS